MKIGDLKKLHQKKYRESLGHFLVEGEHLILELQKAAETNAALRESELYVTKDRTDLHGLFTTHVVSDHQMAQIAAPKTPQGIVAVVPFLPAPPPAPGERAIYLNEIQDPGNLGTILRTLAWFGGFRCLLSPDSVDPYNSKAVRASMGAIFNVPIESDVPLDSLSARYARMACLDMVGDNLAAPEFGQFDCYVFGSESRGLPRAQLDAMKARPYSIDGHHSIESLNLAAAVNICVYEIHRSSAASQRGG
ncbi:MAG: RNA methyltransferase [Steroidobacteraceae bacterium]